MDKGRLVACWCCMSPRKKGGERDMMVIVTETKRERPIQQTIADYRTRSIPIRDWRASNPYIVLSLGRGKRKILLSIVVGLSHFADARGIKNRNRNKRKNVEEWKTKLILIKATSTHTQKETFTILLQTEPPWQNSQYSVRDHSTNGLYADEIENPAWEHCL